VARPNPSPAPRLSYTEPTGLVTADVGALAEQETHESEHFDGGDATDADLAGITFMDCVLDAVNLTDAQLRGAQFVDSRLTATFATSLGAARSGWRRVSIENPRWGSAELFDSRLESVHLRGGKIDFLNLRSATLTDVLIEDAHITELDLSTFRGTRVAIRNCRIETLDLTRASCVDVDLRDSSFSRINGIEGLRGTILNEAQLAEFAPVLADHIGIRVL
jgi:uncharacterized protein YjbI with pentapeptide repeats